MTLGFVALSFALAFGSGPAGPRATRRSTSTSTPCAFLGQVASVWTPTNDLGDGPRRPVRRLPVADGAGFRAAALDRHRRVGRAAASGSGCSSRSPPGACCACWTSSSAARAAWRTWWRAAFYVLNPYTHGLHRPDHDHACSATPRCPGCCSWSTAGVRDHGCAAGAPGGGPRVRADPHLERRRDQRRGGRLDAGRARCCCWSTSRRSARCAGGTPCGFLLRAGVPGPARVAVVDRAAGRCTSGYGIDFLQFTEQPRSIWGTNSVPEALRLMGYWTSYIGVGYHGAAAAAVQRAPARSCSTRSLVGASLLLPALAVLRLRVDPALALRPRSCCSAAGRGRGRSSWRASRSGTPDPRRHGVDLPHTCSSRASCAPPRRRRRWSRSGWPACSARRAGCCGRAARFERGRRRRRALAAGTCGRADRPGRAAARARHGDRAPADLEAHPGRLDRRRAATSTSTRSRTPGPWCCRPDLRLLPWGGTIDAILPRANRRPVAMRYETPYARPPRRPTCSGPWTAGAAGPAAARPAAAARCA